MLKEIRILYNRRLKETFTFLISSFNSWNNDPENPLFKRNLVYYIHKFYDYKIIKRCMANQIRFYEKYQNYRFDLISMVCGSDI